MKVTLGDILTSVSPGKDESESAWQRLYKQPLSATESFRLRRLAPQIDAIIMPFYETRAELVKKLGTSIKDKEDAYTLQETAAEEFNKEIQQLLDSEVELEGDTIKFSRLGNATISAADLDRLNWLIIE